MDDTLSGSQQVSGGILDLSTVPQNGHADQREHIRGDAEETEWCRIDDLRFQILGGDPGDRAGDDAPGQKFVHLFCVEFFGIIMLHGLTSFCSGWWLRLPFVLVPGNQGGQTFPRVFPMFRQV
ncbi:hypothetical protein SDC9_85207 [bioreactor metagenome]|uniref:Uncharacterized protein n=1 Tax=bioreactor metagenome TaxID=1076179 RepID=A0A644ZE43_9ZZZZ